LGAENSAKKLASMIMA